MTEFLSALTGGFIALIGVFIAGFIQDNQNRDKEAREEKSFITSILCEILVYEDLMNSRHDDILKGNLDEDGHFKFNFSTEQNYFTFFDNNSSNMMKITNENVRHKIQAFVLYCKSYFDSLNSHTEILNEYLKRNIEIYQTDSELTKHLFERADSILKDFDGQLIEQAKDLMERHRVLKESLTAYTPC